ncbi:MAG: glycosyltransferase family 4 protein [Haloplanus sp.]
MRVLHVTGAFLPVKGGGPYYVHHLSRHLERAGHACHVVTTDAGGEPDVETVTTTRTPAVTVAGAPVAPTFPATLNRAIRRFDPDVVHANYPLPLYPDAAAVLGRLRSRPVVLTCHGAFETSVRSLVGVVGAVYNATGLRATLRLVDRVHVSNRGVLEAFDAYRRHAAKTSVVPIGVDTAWFDPDAVDGDPPYDVDDDRATVLYVGALRRYKGLDDLVDALADLVVSRDVRLVVVGEGPERRSLQRRAAERGVADAVTVLGHVDDATLRRAYAGADVFALPSPSISESLGLVALEAMAMGVPTVVTAGSGVGRVLSGEAAGLVVEPRAPDALAAAIGSVLDDPALAADQRVAGRNLVTDRFDWRSLVGEYVDVYERALR